jgi:hypothetical protein
VRRVLAGALAIVTAAGALAGCGGVLSPDLFVVSRTGASPVAKLTMLVNEEGVAHCYQDPSHMGAAHHMSDVQIIEARTIQEELRTPASHHLSFPAAPGSVLAYYVRDQDGSVRFADNSPRQPEVTRKLALFMLRVAQGVCGLSQRGA